MILVKTARRFISLSSVNLKNSRFIRINPKTLPNFVESKTHDVQWAAVRQNLLKNQLSVNKTNVDGIIMGICSREKRLDLAKSYLKFMDSQKLQLSDAALGKYLRLRYIAHMHDPSLDCLEDELDIIHICDHIVGRNSELHAELAESVISALCMTKNWRESLDLLHKVRKVDNDGKRDEVVQPEFHFPIVLRAIRENDLKTTWTLLGEAVRNDFAPSTQIIVEFFRKFVDKPTEIERMLNVMSDFSLLMPQSTIDVIKDVLGRKYRTDIVQIKNDGKCWKCRGELRSINLNEDEFEKLSHSFMDDVFTRKDIFFQTTPKELENFKIFVEKKIPFDCVIDGLNVAFSHGQIKDTRILAGNVAAVVRYFKMKKQRVLVIGRLHMSRWPKHQMEYIKKNAVLFLAQDMSHDDPFMLYAALRSGPNTNIFSRDLMRNHSFHLDAESKKLFRRWQQQHQMKLVTTLTKTDIIVQQPINFDLKAHKIDNCWHIPFTDENHRFSYETFNVPTQWLCVELS